MQNHYITKSFYCMGRNLSRCLDCKYCRLLDGHTEGFDLDVCPSEIDPVFRKFPVAINLFYGDPMLQPRHTLALMEKLERAGHEGPVLVITKAPVRQLPAFAGFDLDTHVCLSTFGVDHPLDGGSRKVFEKNLELTAAAGLKMSIEFRPIIYRVNDSDAALEYVFGRAREYGAPIGYCGLQGKPEVLKSARQAGCGLEPYPGTKFSPHKKYLGESVEDRILEFSAYYNIPVFRKTSCLITYQHGFERDYNAHYYRPGEVGCYSCVMKDKCFSFHRSLGPEVYTETSRILPYRHEVVYKKDHTCILARQGICDSVTEHCHNIKGYLIRTDRELTTADVRATKWLTGLTMDVRMRESFRLSDIWNK